MMAGTPAVVLDNRVTLEMDSTQALAGDLQVCFKQGSRPSCRDQEGRRGSEEVVPENLGVPLQGDRDAGELCGGASRVPRTVSTSNS